MRHIVLFPIFLMLWYWRPHGPGRACSSQGSPVCGDSKGLAWEGASPRKVQFRAQNPKQLLYPVHTPSQHSLCPKSPKDRCQAAGGSPQASKLAGSLETSQFSLSCPVFHFSCGKCNKGPGLGFSLSPSASWPARGYPRWPGVMISLCHHQTHP